MLLTFFNNTQQQHNDMPQNVDIVGQQYIAINIVNVCLTLSTPLFCQTPTPGKTWELTLLSHGNKNKNKNN